MIRIDCREITSVWFTAASERDSVFGMLSYSVCTRIHNKHINVYKYQNKLLSTIP